MREIRTSGSEGGGAEPNRFSLPLSPVRPLRTRFLAERALQGGTTTRRTTGHSFRPQ